MQMRSLCPLVIAPLGALVACGSSTPAAGPEAPAGPDDPLALAGPGPALVAAVSSADPEFGFAYDPVDGTAYFDRASADRARLTIYQTTWTDGAWAPARVAPWSGRYRDIDPALTPDGTRLYFSSDRPTSGTTARGDFDLWALERVGARWADPVRVGGEVNDDRSTGAVSIATDRTLYFDATRDDVREIYEAHPTADGYGLPTPVALGLDPGSKRSNPCVAPDHAFLIYVLDPGPVGRADLVVAFREADGAWSAPEPLVGVNSPAADFAPALSPDGRYLFFTSERPGVVPAPADGRPPGDIYQIDLAAALPPR
ncbi:MAG: PD40 domain-containing protein [Myxococcales bacterium]|nr:PD40 domain-containing protein [Myxococcales bacterium]